MAPSDPTKNNTPDLSTRSAIVRFLECVLPGRSQSVCVLREQIVVFCSSLTLKSVILRGPIGSGKSTVARLMGLLRRTAPLEVGEATRLLRDASFDGLHRVDLRYIPWYVELPLTGLVESLAESQLFGVTKGAYTGAGEQRAGVFEQAAKGRDPAGKEPAGARLTGGIVFLDEIGDLSHALQAKLLPVLSGAPFYRLGGEGDPEHEVVYRGVTVSASWKRLDDGTLRPDLLSRVSSYAIDVPGIDDRMDDFDLLLDEVQRLLREAFRRAVDDAKLADSAFDREYWQRRLDSFRLLTDTSRNILRGVEWTQHGNLRGLTAAVDQILANDRDPKTVVAELPLVTSPSPQLFDDGSAGLLGRLLKREGDGDGLAGHLRAIEVEGRRDLRDLLLDNEASRRRLARALGIAEPKLLAQIQQLDRRRRGSRRR